MLALISNRNAIAGAAALLGIVGAFLAGWQVNGWHLGKRAADLALEQQRATQAALTELTNEVNALNLRTQERESVLLADLERERSLAEELRNDIRNRPVIRREVRVPVEGECPAIESVDWVQFAASYNAAARGTREDSPGGGNATVPGTSDRSD